MASLLVLLHVGVGSTKMSQLTTCALKYRDTCSGHPKSGEHRHVSRAAGILEIIDSAVRAQPESAKPLFLWFFPGRMEIFVLRQPFHRCPPARLQRCTDHRRARAFFIDRVRGGPNAVCS